tara:strand:- start:54 stop:596 length:543 start_codon:yes stop_codon:yes gene_type:complete
MQSLKLNGDNIAGEFFNIMKKASKNDPFKELDKGLDDAVAAAKDPEGVSSFYNELETSLAGVNREAVQEMINEPHAPADHSNAVDTINSAYDGFGIESSAGNTVLDGLAKIASNLRGKGEGFAADVVEATATGIKGDLMAEACRADFLSKSLKKIANDFYRDGEQLAGDMVQVTINNLNS